MVAGTGVFTRDVNFGRSGTPGDRVFQDLAARFNQRGMAVVRFDRRGARYGVPREERTDKAVAPTATPENLSQDVEALYDWTRSERGLGAQCVVLFGHSEGTVHIAGLAERGSFRQTWSSAWAGCWRARRLLCDGNPLTGSWIPC